MKFTFPKNVEQPIGFDLLERDWVDPHGKGKRADCMVSFDRQDPDAEGHFPLGNMSLTFPNPIDGILPVFSAAEGGSVLWSHREAPDGKYEKSFQFSSHPQDDGIHPSLEFSKRTWVIRVRSVTDDEGNLVSALYGKIQGAPEVIFFSHGPAFRMTYYLNGNPNERGLEWDQKNNLFSDLPKLHWPQNP